MVGAWVVSVPLGNVQMDRGLGEETDGQCRKKKHGMLPAVSMGASTFPPLIVRGINHSSLEPNVAPLTSALQV
jgi:hypothetical protein